MGNTIGEERDMVVNNKLSRNSIYKGMTVAVDQLSDIYNTYMIVQFDNPHETQGKLVYIGEEQTDEYDNWFKQKKPITPIYNDKGELEDMSVYDE
jgi:hypothetical protein